jgi:hypothetical protein
MPKLFAILSLVAFLLNVVVHLLTFVDGVPVSLGITWPVYLLTLILALMAVGVKITDTGNCASRTAKMSRDRMMVQVRHNLRQGAWVWFFGTTPVWMVAAFPVLFLFFAVNMLFESRQSEISELRMGSSGFAMFAWVALIIFTGRYDPTESKSTDTQPEKAVDEPLVTPVEQQRIWNKAAEGSLELDGQVVNFEFSSCLVYTEDELAGNLDVMVRTNPDLPAEKLSVNLQLSLPGFEQLIESDAFGYCGDGIAEVSFSLGNSGIRFDDVREAIMSIRDVGIFWSDGRKSQLATLPCEFASPESSLSRQ